MTDTATPSASATPDLQPHHDALLGQWKRAKQLRDFPTLRELAATKGLDLIKSATLDSLSYKVFRGDAKLRNFIKHGDLVTIGAFVDAYTPPATT